MRSRFVILAVVAVFLGGCAPSRIPVSELSGFEELDQRIGGKTGQVVLASGLVVHARNIHVDADSVSWSDRGTGERTSVSTLDVESIKIHKKARGALKGLLYGGGSGLAFASLIYWGDPDEPYASVVFVIMPVLGALIGTPAGMTADSDVYEFTQPTETEEEFLETR